MENRVLNTRVISKTSDNIFSEIDDFVQFSCHLWIQFSNFVFFVVNRQPIQVDDYYDSPEYNQVKQVMSSE